MLLWLSLACAPPLTDTASAADTAASAPVAGTCTELTYESFGQAFMLSWCMNCHSASTTGASRYGAPPGVDLDTHADVQALRDRIAARVSVEAPTMPPVGGASRSERTRLAEWLACGAP